MPRFTDEAVCIRHWDFSETSQTVSLFSREHGLIRGLAKGSKREKSRFSGGIEILTRGQITAITKPSTDLATLTEWDLGEIFSALRQSLKAYYAGLYLADLLQHLVSEGDAHERLFDIFIGVLRGFGAECSLAQSEKNEKVDGGAEAKVGMCMLAFQWAILCETGYQPVLDRDVQHNTPIHIPTDKTTTHTLAFSASAGGLVADTGERDRWRVRRETVDLLRDLNRVWDDSIDADPQEGDDSFVADCIDMFSKRKISPSTVDRANRLLAAYLRTILDRELPTMRFILGEIPR